MMVFLLLISLIGYFLFIAKIFRWSVAATPLFVVCMIPSFLYIFGIFNMLALGAHFLFYIGLAFFAGYLWLCFKEKQVPYAEIFHPGLILFILYFVFLYLVCRSLSYYGWDVFSHWGLITKEMILTNRLTDSDSVVVFKSYTPGTALFHYFVVSITGYSEGMVHFAHNIFLAASFMILFQGIKSKQVYSIILITLITYNLVFFWGGFTLQSITTDHFIGIAFGTSILGYFLFQGSAKGRLAYLIPVLFFLPLVKQIGFFLVLCVALIVIFDHLYCFYYRKEQTLGNQPARDDFNSGLFSCPKPVVKSTLLTFILLIVVVGGPFVSRASWTAWLNKHKIQETFNTSNISLVQIQKSFSKESATPRDKETLKRFQDVFFQNPVLSGAVDSYLGKHILNKQVMSAASCLFICLMLALAGILLQPTPGKRQRILICQAVILIFFVMYCFVHLLLYLYYFGAYEGPLCASLVRYLSIFFLGWSLISMGFLVAIPMESTERHRVSRLLLTIILAFLILLAPSANRHFFFGEKVSFNIRSEVEQNIPLVDKHCPLNSSIYYIWQNDNSRGLRHWIFTYGICPRKTNFWGWSLGKPYYEGDDWTFDYTPEQLLDVFKEYDYLLIAKSDEKFWKRYGALFNDVDLTKYSLAAKAQKAYLGNLMRDGTMKTIEQGSVNWGGWSVARVNDGVTDWGVDNAYGYTYSDAEVVNNDSGLTLTFNRSVALTTLFHWSYSNLTFNYVIEYYTGGAWAPVATIACPTGSPTVISFNADQSKSSTQWRWYISDWNNPGRNFYAFELEVYESIQAYLEYNNYFSRAALFKIIKSPNGNISIRKIE